MDPVTISIIISAVGTGVSSIISTIHFAFSYIKTKNKTHKKVTTKTTEAEFTTKHEHKHHNDKIKHKQEQLDEYLDGNKKLQKSELTDSTSTNDLCKSGGEKVVKFTTTETTAEFDSINESNVMIMGMDGSQPEKADSVIA